MNIELLEQIEAAGGKLEKERLLRQADGELRAFLEQCLDPDITYGITVDEDEQLNRWPGTIKTRSFWSILRETLAALAKRNLTGNLALNEVDNLLLAAPDEAALKWAARLINKNLRAGFDIRTYNKAWGEGTVEKFAVQLADTYEPDMELHGRYYIQPKLDGNRVVLIDDVAKSRNGKLYPAGGAVVQEILDQNRHFFEKWVVDGEMMGDLGFDQSSGALRRIHQKDRKQATFTYWAFDLIDRKEWEQRETVELARRWIDLENTFGARTGSVRVVPTVVIDDPTHAQLMGYCDRFLAQGFEGAMLKDAQSPYVFKRGRNLLKVKRFRDIDLEVIGFYEGKGKHRGRLGGLIVSNETPDDDGITCKVGSGFDDALREEIWRDQKEWLGAVVEIQYQDITKDGSLRFPVFVRRRMDKE